MKTILSDNKNKIDDFELFSELVDRTNNYFANLQESEPIAKYYVKPIEDELSGYSMQAVIREVVYDLKRLIQIMLSMITERSMIALDKTTVTHFLKNSNWGNVYTLDFMHSSIRQFTGIRCLSLSAEKLCCTFKNPLNLDKCLEILVKPQTPIGAMKIERRVSKKICNYYLEIDGNDILSVSDYNVAFLFKVNSDNWEAYLQMLAEIIIRVHQGGLYRSDIQTIYMSYYNQFYRLMAPEMFIDHLTPVLIEISQLTISSLIDKDESFLETKISQLYREKDKQYKFDCDIDHIKYLVVCPSKKEIYLSFRPFLDFSKIKEFAEQKGYILIERRKEVKAKIFIKKGASGRIAGGNRHLSVIDVYKDEKKIMSFEGKSGILFYLDNTDCFRAALNLFTIIYYGWMYYTSFFPNEDIPHSDLSPEDRIVIDNINTLTQIYSTFISPVLERENFERVKNTNEKMQSFSPGEWLINYLKNDQAVSYEEKMLHLLLHMKSLIDLDKMLAMTPGSDQYDIEIRSRLTEIHMKFIRLLKVTETYVNIKKIKYSHIGEKIFCTLLGNPR